MPKEMSVEQMRKFIGIAQLGCACGLYHPFEWLENYLRGLDVVLYKMIPKLEKEAEDAFLSFMHGTMCEPDDPVGTLDIRGLRKSIDAYYEDARKKNEKTSR